GRDESLSGLDLADLDLSTRAKVRNREFGFVFQFYHLLPDLSVIENVMLPAMIHHGRSSFKKRKAEFLRRAEELLERVAILARKEGFSTKPALRWRAAKGSHCPRPHERATDHIL